MRFYHLAFVAFIFALQISSSVRATEIDDARYEFTSFAAISADRALADLSKRLKMLGLEQIVITPSTKTRALAIAQLDGIFLNADLTEGIFIKFGISPTRDSLRRGKIELEDGTLFHGKMHSTPVAVFAKALDFKRRSQLIRIARGWLLAAHDSRRSFSEFLLGPTAFADDESCRFSNVSAKIDSLTEPLSKILGNSTAAQSVSGCVIGALKTGWILTGGLPEGIANFIYSPISSLKRYWSGVTGTVDLIGRFFRDFTGEASKAWDGFSNLPAAEKAKIACQVVSMIGAGTLIAYVTGGLGASEILNQIRRALDKILEKIPGTPAAIRLSGPPTEKARALSPLPESKPALGSRLAMEKKQEVLNGGGHSREIEAPVKPDVSHASKLNSNEMGIRAPVTSDLAASTQPKNVHSAIELQKPPSESELANLNLRPNEELYYVIRKDHPGVELLLITPASKFSGEIILVDKNRKVLSWERSKPNLKPAQDLFRNLNGTPLSIDRNEIVSLRPFKWAHDAKPPAHIPMPEALARKLIGDHYETFYKDTEMRVVGKGKEVRDIAMRLKSDIKQFDEYMDKLGFGKPKNTRIIVGDPKKPFDIGPFSVSDPYGNLRDLRVYDSTIVMDPAFGIKGFMNDKSVAFHERVHSRLRATYKSNAYVNQLETDRVIQEAISDFISTNYLGDPEIGKGLISRFGNEGALRNVSSAEDEMGKSIKTVLDLGYENAHGDAMLYTSTLWRIRDALGKEKVDSLIKPMVDDLNRNAVSVEPLRKFHADGATARGGPQFKKEAEDFAYFLASLQRTAEGKGLGAPVNRIIDQVISDTRLNPARVEEYRNALRPSGDFNRNDGVNLGAVILVNGAPYKKEMIRAMGGAGSFAAGGGVLIYEINNSQKKVRERSK